MAGIIVVCVTYTTELRKYDRVLTAARNDRRNSSYVYDGVVVIYCSLHLYTLFWATSRVVVLFVII
jgi:hypothetical protein